ncbi:MAG TPA: hypothetical protein VGD12_08620 [Blastococcus sp.]|jgi:hypothetical protein
MTTIGTLRGTAVLLSVLAVAACAQRSDGGSPPSGAPAPPGAELPGDPASLVLRVEYTGGFLPQESALTRLPSYSVYADGRLITDGPVAAIHPGAALPRLQVQVLDAATVQGLADRAMAAGVAQDSDLGRPPIADSPSTRVTLVTAEGTHVREVYALAGYVGEEDALEGALTAEQRTGRAQLRGLLTALGDLGQQPTPEEQVPAEPYAAEAVAAIARPWSAPQGEAAQGSTPEPVPWPGPALPGEPTGGLPDLGCVTATGDEGAAVLAAARSANARTPWSTPDGARWSVSFRPLLPDESGCADLRD